MRPLHRLRGYELPLSNVAAMVGALMLRAEVFGDEPYEIGKSDSALSTLSSTS